MLFGVDASRRQLALFVWHVSHTVSIYAPGCATRETMRNKSELLDVQGATKLASIGVIRLDGGAAINIDNIRPFVDLGKTFRSKG